MRKLKFIILFFCIFLLSGCSVEYNLTIDESTMEEDINAIFDKATESEIANRMERVRRTSYYNLDTRENEYYNFKKREDENNIILNYNYIYTSNNLYKSEAASRCYYKRIVNVTDDYITIDTDEQVACLYKDGEKQIDNITVNIKTNLPVVSNNADNVTSNTYTWYINDDNYTNKPISIKIEKQEAGEPFDIESISVLIVVIVFLILCIIIYLIMRVKHKKNNKIK